MVSGLLTPMFTSTHSDYRFTESIIWSFARLDAEEGVTHLVLFLPLTIDGNLCIKTILGSLRLP